ncbi:YraN family protein [Phyllobacterium sp. YR531]|uniref:YraN family protein n=1 Tax=Phyllobacterium sp. YR531 TaxID=1144343 RepID=UPI0002D959E4|nr:YraN family protein [Phyllobacterium sp. YR531]
MSDRGKRHEAYRRGHSAERLAAIALMLKGYRIIGRRYRTRLGEIDLIARRGDVILIIEVKARATLQQAMDSVDRQTMRRIEAAADQWLARQPDHERLSLRFDLVAILPWRWPVHVPAAFTA